MKKETQNTNISVNTNVNKNTHIKIRSTYLWKDALSLLSWKDCRLLRPWTFVLWALTVFTTLTFLDTPNFLSTFTLGLGSPAKATSMVKMNRPFVKNGGRVVNKSYSGYITRGLDLRHQRKVGIGFGVAGPLGVAGAQLEINFTPEMSILGGFGLGPGYQSYHFQVKKILGSSSLLPYLSLGLARWYSTGNPKPRMNTTPNFVSKKFLSDKEKRTGELNENMIYPGVGLQWVQLDGPWQGFSIYLEALALFNVSEMATELTGGSGLIYYF